MKKFFKSKKSEGLPNGPNYVNTTSEGFIISERGQWDYPGQKTLIPSNNITMKGVPYPVFGTDDMGYSQMMYPGMNYTYPGNMVYEIPMMQEGGAFNPDTDEFIGFVDELPKAQLGNETNNEKYKNFISKSDYEKMQSDKKLKKETEQKRTIEEKAIRESSYWNNPSSLRNFDPTKFNDPNIQTNVKKECKSGEYVWEYQPCPEEIQTQETTKKPKGTYSNTSTGKYYYIWDEVSKNTRKINARQLQDYFNKYELSYRSGESGGYENAPVNANLMYDSNLPVGEYYDLSKSYNGEPIHYYNTSNAQFYQKAKGGYMYPDGGPVTSSNSPSNFDRSSKTTYDYFKKWYEGRAKNPKFTDVANSRLNLLNSGQYPKTNILPYDQMTTEGLYTPSKNTIDYSDTDLNNKYYGDINTLMTHENDHWLSNKVPQEFLNISSGFPEDFKNNKNWLSGKDALTQDEEIRARLSVWRQLNNIDPTKDYSPKELRSIINKNLNDENLDSNVKDIYELIKGDAEKLKYLNDSFVSNQTKSQDMQYAANGGPIGDDDPVSPISVRDYIRVYREALKTNETLNNAKGYRKIYNRDDGDDKDEYINRKTNIKDYLKFLEDAKDEAFTIYNMPEHHSERKNYETVMNLDYPSYLKKYSSSSKEYPKIGSDYKDEDIISYYLSENLSEKDFEKIIKNHKDWYNKALWAKSEDYYKEDSPNTFYQRELNWMNMNKNLPMGFYDKRITPNDYVEYKNDETNDLYGLYLYDPIKLKEETLLKYPKTKEGEYKITQISGGTGTIGNAYDYQAWLPGEGWKSYNKSDFEKLYNENFLNQNERSLPYEGNESNLNYKDQKAYGGAKGGLVRAQEGKENKLRRRNQSTEDDVLFGNPLKELEVIDEGTGWARVWQDEYNRRSGAQKSFQESWYPGQEYDPTNIERRSSMAADDAAAQYIIKNHASRNDFANRQEYLKSFTPQEAEVIRRSNYARNFDPDIGSRFRRGLGSLLGTRSALTNPDPDLSREDYENRNFLTNVGDIASIAGYPLNLLKGAFLGQGRSTLSGETSDPWMGAHQMPLGNEGESWVYDVEGDIAIDPLNVLGIEGLGSGARNLAGKIGNYLPENTMWRGYKPVSIPKKISMSEEPLSSVSKYSSDDLLAPLGENTKAIIREEYAKLVKENPNIKTNFQDLGDIYGNKSTYYPNTREGQQQAFDEGVNFHRQWFLKDPKQHDEFLTNYQKLIAEYLKQTDPKLADDVVEFNDWAYNNGFIDEQGNYITDAVNSKKAEFNSRFTEIQKRIESKNVIEDLKTKKFEQNKKELIERANQNVDPDVQRKIENIYGASGKKMPINSGIERLGQRNKNQLIHFGEKESMENLSPASKEYLREQGDNVSGIFSDDQIITLGSKPGTRYYEKTYTPFKINDTEYIPETEQVLDVFGYRRMSDPEYIGNIAAHEGGHDWQRLYDFKTPVTHMDPSYGYPISAKDNPLGQRLSEAMVDPKLVSERTASEIARNKKFSNDTWLANFGELHSEMMSARNQLAREYMKKNNMSLEDAVSLIKKQEMENPEILDYYLENKNINKHFKPTTSPEEKRSILKEFVPVLAPITGGLLTAKAMQPNQRKLKYKSGGTYNPKTDEFLGFID